MAFLYRHEAGFLVFVSAGNTPWKKIIWNLKKSWLEDEQFSFEMVPFLGDIQLMVQKSG